jgi:asparagine synthase (glutamine-hydrolysing)
MCGITGMFGAQGGELEPTVRRMVAALHHRGPDDSGIWSDGKAGVALGHARLSILDLTAEGHQPMPSAGGRFVITYNGEIYNFAELRDELSRLGHAFRGHSDTEVMLASFEQWGVQEAVRRFLGMFAFALWDRAEQVLYLVRDRVGIKPLYFGWAGDTLLFGSELKALQAHAGFKNAIDLRALALFLRYGYVPAPFSIFQTIHKLSPGCVLAVPKSFVEKARTFSPDPDDPDAGWKPARYWSVGSAVEQGLREPFAGSEEEAVEHLDDLLRTAVRMHMVSDVPLGAFLSGGVDSSTIVALMQAQSSRPVKTFSIGFHETDYDEAQHASKVARHLGTDHTELYVTPAEGQAVIPRLPALYDEPFADSSQIPTLLVSALARRQVTVSLSGDGGDELFGGYNRYLWCARVWDRIGGAPVWLRGLAARGLTAVSPQRWDAVFRALGPMLPRAFNQPTPGYKLHKLADALCIRDLPALYLSLVSYWKDPPALLRPAVDEPDIFAPRRFRSRLTDFTQQMMGLDLMTYLPDDILVKVDRASMAHSLEARVPFLDHRVVEFAWRLPLSMKIRDGQSKRVLRRVLDRYVPRPLIERPKMGFCVPVDSWLRGPLRDWGESLLDERRLRTDGFFDPRMVRDKWAEHLSGRRDWQYPLWAVLMFQAWVDEHKLSSSGAVR